MSSPVAGWYPDPGGQAGMFRWWDGRSWSAALSPTPQAAPPAQGLVGGSQAPGSPPLGGQAPGQQPLGRGGAPAGHGPSAHPYGPGAAPQAAARGAGKGWIIALVAVVVVVGVVVTLGVRAVSQVAGPDNPTAGPGGQATQQICPEPQPFTPDPDAVPDPLDGRVYGGDLSYPRLGAPWDAPHPEVRVPFGRDVMTQTAFVEDYIEGSWVASVLVGELSAGDGFFTPQQGSDIVVRCVIGSFYGTGTDVAREDRVNQATTVDGEDAWLVESHLTFEIPGLETTGETLIVLIVDTGETSASLFYASIPDTSPQFDGPARQAMAELRVED